MRPNRQFRLLLTLFRGRFFESDDAAPGSGFQTNINQVLGFLFTSGFVISYLMFPAMATVMGRNRGAQLALALRGLQLVVPVFTFAVGGFAAFFEWDMLFPNRRDFLILAPFPIRMRDLFAAQFLSLAQFLGLLVLAANTFPMLFAFLMGLSARFALTGLKMALAEAVMTACTSSFAFFGVAAFQGLLINLTTPRLFRRISPYVQACGLSLTILSVVTYPTYVRLLSHAAETHQAWLWFFPPVWFTGIYDLFTPGAEGIFVSLGAHSLRMLGAAMAVFGLTWAIAFRRHFRRTLEAEDTEPRPSRKGIWNSLARSPHEGAIFQFSGRTLARSRKHQLFLVTYFSVGFSLALNSAIDVDHGRIVLDSAGARAFPFLIAFFVVSGFRAVYQFPAELASNWIFRITETGWAEISRTVTRKRVLVSGIAPAMLLLGPAALVVWGPGLALLHLAFELATAALLTELMFWTFDKVPFTCSYYPGRNNLSILFVLYLYGFTLYSSQLAGLEQKIEGRFTYSLLFFLAAGGLLTLFCRRHPGAAAARFDANEPVIQRLDIN
jgi:hypothetical protein